MGGFHVRIICAIAQITATKAIFTYKPAKNKTAFALRFELNGTRINSALSLNDSLVKSLVASIKTKKKQKKRIVLSLRIELNGLFSPWSGSPILFGFVGFLREAYFNGENLFARNCLSQFRDSLLRHGARYLPHKRNRSSVCEVD